MKKKFFFREKDNAAQRIEMQSARRARARARARGGKQTANRGNRRKTKSNREACPRDVGYV